MLHAIGAYAATGLFEALACSVRNKDIDSWFHHFWHDLFTLLNFWFAVPLIDAAEKFFVP